MVEIIRAIGSMVKDGTPNTMTPEERVEQIYEKMDTDADGSISLEEFVNAAKNDHSLSSMLHTDKVGIA